MTKLTLRRLSLACTDHEVYENIDGLNHFLGHVEFSKKHGCWIAVANEAIHGFGDTPQEAAEILAEIFGSGRLRGEPVREF